VTPPPPAITSAPQAIGLGRPIRTERATARLLVWALGDDAWMRTRLLVDTVLLCSAAAAALFADPAVSRGGADRWLALLFPLAMLALSHGRRGPDERIDGSMMDTATHVGGLAALASMAMLVLGAVATGVSPLGIAVRLWLFTTVYVGGGRIVLHWARREARVSGLLGTPTLIVGAGNVGAHLAQRLKDTPSYGLRPVGFLDADPLTLAPGRRVAMPVLGGAEDLMVAAAATGARHIVLAFSSEPDGEMIDRIREAQRAGIKVSLVPRMFESVNDRSTLDHVGGVPLLSLEAVNPYGWQFAVKHVIDTAIAGLALLVLSPLMVAIALAVRLSSPGPIVFRQRRVGRDGREFDVLKFRTMRVAPAEENFDLPDGVAPGGVEGSDRRTRVGGFLRAASLDELPQLINVVRGEMSLVGPRPERPEYIARFSEQVNRYDDRHRVKSGITGWAQVNGLRGQTSIADRVEWDNYYIQNWSLGLDLRIVGMTVGEVLRFRERPSASKR
jgi:exopolysaccharide biosynthesis polyprenyl glycosylphosphotransferase